MLVRSADPQAAEQVGSVVARVVVEVMPKPEILDPQGKAVRGALARLGFADVSNVRQGKRFEIEVDGVVDADLLAQVHTMAETLLANPVIEDFTVHTEGVLAERPGTEGQRSEEPRAGDAQ